ncbi:hypothetical protein F5887DRAFT_1193437 [Amanita rubescens]|nr:hypothetical protein F5887DRAFT_1193437 [Amanita rubescens]
MFNSTNSTAEELIALIHGWIKRSGVLPLALSLRVTSSYRSQVPMVEAMLGAFIQYASRWEHFHFHCIDFIPITFPEFGDMPHVRSFTLNCPGLEDPKLQISSWPMLTVLRWPLHPTASSSHSPPWHQLTRLALGCSMKARETLFVIQSCPRLTELEIKYYDDDDILDQSPHGIAVVNDCLRKLNLNVWESCAQLLKRLTLPALTEMTLYFDSCVSRIHKALLRFFTRSKCKLDRLDLADPNFDGNMLLKCLKHDSCASITNLSIANICIKPMVTDSVLVALADVSDVLLPNLAHLELHMCLGGSPGWLGPMLLSRCIKKDNELKTVRIICRSLSRSDAMLVAFVETRLKVALDIDDS